MKFAKKSKSKKINSTNKNVIIPKKNKKLRWWPKALIILLGLVVLSGVIFAGNVYINLRKVISTKSGISAEGLKGEIDLSKLKGEGEGRVNILLLGTGDIGHAGQDLTDTMIVASIDPRSNDVVMLGIPRDLYVRVPGYGWNKINSAHALAEQSKPGSGPELIKKTISDIIDQPIQYYSRVDFTGLKLAVDKLGGVNVFNPEDLQDPEYPCDKNENFSCGFALKTGYYKMNGALALKFARCRKGTCGDDYGRARRQQAVIVGMRDQALQLGNILNPAKVSELISIVGDHLKTDLNIEELKRLSDIGRKVDSKSITNKVLENETEGLVKNSNVGEASVVVPSAGVGNYKSIQAFVKSLLIDGYLKDEKAKITINNSSAAISEVYTVSGVLKSLGYNVIKTASAKTAGDGKTTLKDFTKGSKPYTIKYLENRFGIKASQVERNDNESDIIITLGENYEFKDNN